MQSAKRYGNERRGGEGGVAEGSKTSDAKRGGGRRLDEEEEQSCREWL